MTRIEVTFLGTTAAIPTKYRNHAAIYVTYRSENEFSYLWDCGEGTQRQIFTAGLNFMRLNEIFISHWHADHFAGLLGLLETMSLENRQKQLSIFAPEAERFVPSLTNLGYSTKDFPIVAKSVYHDGSSIQTLVDEQEFQIQSMPMRHGIPAVAYALVEKDRIKIDSEKAKKLGLPEKGPIFRTLKENGEAVFKGQKIRLEDVSNITKGKKVVYSGDTLVNRNMLKLAENADLLIHDSTFFAEMKEEGYKHATFEDVIKLAKEASVKQVVLTHISRRYQDIQELKEKISKHENVRIAKDFMKVVVE